MYKYIETCLILEEVQLMWKFADEFSLVGNFWPFVFLEVIKIVKRKNPI